MRFWLGFVLILCAPLSQVGAIDLNLNTTIAGPVVEQVNQIESTTKSLADSQSQVEKGRLSKGDFQKQAEQAKKTVEGLGAQGENDPYVQNSVARFYQRAAYGSPDVPPADPRSGAEAAEAADRAVRLATAQKNPEALRLALRTRSVGKYYGGDYPGSTADAQEILKNNPQDPIAKAVIAAIGGRAKPVGLLAGSGGGRDGAKEKTPAAPANGGAPRTPEQWAARQREHPTEAGRLIAQSMRAMKGGDLENAAREARAAVDADPNDAMAWSQSALLSSRLGDYSSAVTDATRAVNLGWKWAPVLDVRAKAQVHAARGRGAASEKKIYYRKALEDAEAAILADPKYASAYRTRGWAKLGLGAAKPEDILSDFTRAAQLDPQRFGEDAELIRAALRKGDYGSAQELLAAREPAPHPNPLPPGATEINSDRKFLAVSAGAALLIIGLLSIALFRTSARPITVIANTQLPLGEGWKEPPAAPARPPHPRHDAGDDCASLPARAALGPGRDGHGA